MAGINSQSRHGRHDQQQNAGCDICHQLPVIPSVISARKPGQAGNGHRIDRRHQLFDDLIDADGHSVESRIVVTGDPAQHGRIRAHIDCDRQAVGKKNEHGVEVLKDRPVEQKADLCVAPAVDPVGNAGEPRRKNRDAGIFQIVLRAPDKEKHGPHAQDLQGYTADCDIEKILVHCIDPFNAQGRQQNGRALDQDDSSVVSEPGYREQQRKQNRVGKSCRQQVQGKGLRGKAVKLRSSLFFRAFPDPVIADAQGGKEGEIGHDRISVINLSYVFDLQHPGNIGKGDQREQDRTCHLNKIQRGIQAERFCGHSSRGLLCFPARSFLCLLICF